MGSSGRVIESYITELVLPNEAISAYVKWDPSFPVKSVSALFEADVFLFNALDVDEKVWKDYDNSKGRLDVESQWLQIPGFFGFRATYTVIPEDERVLDFGIMINFEDGKTERVDLRTRVVRPLLVPVNPNPEVFADTPNYIPRPINLLFANKGSAYVRTGAFNPTTQILAGKGLKISATTRGIDVTMGNRLFGESKAFATAFAVSGRGYGEVRISFEYEDLVGNRYKTQVMKILFTVQEKANLEVPINGEVNERSPVVIEQPLIIS